MEPRRCFGDGWVRVARAAIIYGDPTGKPLRVALANQPFAATSASAEILCSGLVGASVEIRCAGTVHWLGRLTRLVLATARSWCVEFGGRGMSAPLFVRFCCDKGSDRLGLWPGSFIIL
jgi:hypothetical protein